MSQTTPSTSPASKQNLNQLSQEDVARLLDDKAAESARLDIAIKLTNHYDDQNITPSELQIAEQIFRLLVRDTEIRIRKQLSAQLKASHHLPRDIALTMANDVTDVALPILEYSTVLSDQDLADLVAATNDSSRHVAIAKRPNVAEGVVEALLEHSQEPVVALALAENQSAQLNDEAFHTLIQRHCDLPDMMDVIATRPHLPATLKEKVIVYVSDQIKNQLMDQMGLAKEIIQQQATQTRLQATLDLINNDLDEGEMVKLVEQLLTFDRLTPELLLAVVAHGYIHFYVVAMSVMAKVSIENVHKLMSDRGGLGFRGLYNKSQLAPEHYTVLRDITPIAIMLKEEMSGLEGAMFAKLLSKKTIEHLKKIDKPHAHIESALQQVMH